MARRPLHALASALITDRHREISRREARSEGLQRRRGALLAKLAAIDAELGGEPSAGAKRRRRERPRRGPIASVARAPGTLPSSPTPSPPC